jgi:murein DD-endopeptidase MepM/ murein hydrolase activator NlpD
MRVRVLLSSLAVVLILSTWAHAAPAPPGRNGSTLATLRGARDALDVKIAMELVRIHVANSRLVALKEQVRADREAIASQTLWLQQVRAEQDAALAAIAEVDVQAASLPSPGGQDDGFLYSVDRIQDPAVKSALSVAIAEEGQIRENLSLRAADATARVDYLLDLFRAVAFDIHWVQQRQVALVRRQHRILSSLTSDRMDLQDVQGKISVLESGAVSGSAPVLAGGPVPGSPFQVCPVDPPRVVADDFGAPRYAGGYHQHAGNDILAPRGTPIRAPFDGVAEDATNGLGGLSVRVTGSDGYVYNAHLDRMGTLGRVTAGEVVGFVGDSGDAKGGPTHDHFEWHPNEADGPTVSGAVDPHPYLTLVCD